MRILLFGLLLIPPTVPQVAGTPPCAGCIAVLMPPGQPLPDQLGGLDVLLRVGPGDARATVLALDDIARRGGRPGIVLDGGAAARVPAELVAKAALVLIDLRGGPAAEPDAVAFALKTQLTAARAMAARPVELGVAGPPSVIDALLSRDAGPYLDFIVWAGEPSATRQRVWRVGGVLSGVGAALDAMRAMKGEKMLWELPSASDLALRVLKDLARAAPLLPPGLVAASNVRVTCGDRLAEAYLNPQTLDTIAVAAACPPGDPIAITPPERNAERVVLSSGETLIRVPAPAAADRFAEGVRVVGGLQLSVEEIIARHQAAAAKQSAAIHEVISTGTLTMSFETPGFPAPVTISSQTTIYAAAGRTEIAQRDIRVNGMAFPGRSVPRLPIIEPERVSAPPLAITLTGVYRYRLAGRETIGGVPCYIVGFAPRDTATPLFRGRAWIAADSFVMVRVSAAQTGLRGPIVSSEQEDEFRPEPGGLWLLNRSEVRQVYEGAAHRTPIHRVLSIAVHEVNPTAFAPRRRAAFSSGAVMLRDTPEGFRYLKPVRPSDATAAEAEPEVEGRAERVRTLAAGVIVDPNITRPLPFAGISYVDFDLFGTGTQLNAFFGGTYAQVAFSVPSIYRSRWQLAGRAFGIASSYNDRAFVRGIERYEEAVRQRPAHASIWLLRPVSARISMRLGYDLDYTHFASGEATARSFVVPPHQVVHGARLAIDGQRDGWNGSIWWNPAVRAGWRPWGLGSRDEYRPEHRDFQRYGMSVARLAVLSPRVVGRVEGAWMAGHDLDRFSRYSFGTFDNRLRGYPSALIRYDRGGVVRGALAWAAGKFLRADAFLDSAAVHDPGFGRGLRNYTGIGAALEAPLPFGILIAVEWGYGIRGVNSDGSVGTQVVRVSGYKVF